MPTYRLTIVLLLGLFFEMACQHRDNVLVPVDSMCQRARRMEGFTTVPVKCTGQDQDGDGIDDAADLCPMFPETPNNVYDLDGCPDPDADGDRVVDYQDACPRRAGLVPDGCPMEDADGDLIADHLDSCPLQREDIDGEFDQDGCPEGAQIYANTIDGVRVFRSEAFSFKDRSHQLKDKDQNLLEEISDSLLGQVQHVSKVHLNVYVKKDEAADKDRRMGLAQKRVKPIAAAMLKAGVAAELVQQTYFEIDEQSQRGPRVELIILWQDVLQQPSPFQ
ncbi:MAG: hypothetical protein CMH56_00175 [Myxococcales bacterium]|nr:hypothetical protein [Myxococcales bacterium]|tara:strand:- start:2748 stop:3578 length:831 start_codon:yes stop_codon:yes gene_type:complete